MSEQQWTRNEYVTYLLLTLVFLSSWTDINGIFAELPQIILTQPEGWKLAAYLALITNLGNIAPLTLVLIKCCRKKQTFDPIPINYIVILIGMLSCFLLIFFWQYTTVIHRQQYSVALLLLALFLSFLDCTSSISFADYVQKFRQEFTSALFLGESLTSILPSLLAMAQGNGQIRCRLLTNDNRTMETIYTTARFSVSMYFLCLFSLLTISFISFGLLQWTSIARHARQIVSISSSKSIELELDTKNMLLEQHTSVLSKDTSTLSRTSYLLLCLGCIYTSSILFGMLLSISTYVLMPYGHRIFYLGTIVSPWTFTIIWLLGMLKPIVLKRFVLILIILGSLTFAGNLFIALKSPCPPWVDTNRGSVMVLSLWLSTYVLLGYPRLIIANYVRSYSSSGLFWYGVCVQLGALIGSITAYLLVETFSVFYERLPCEVSQC
jgi:riboflavin transporter 2